MGPVIWAAKVCEDTPIDSHNAALNLGTFFIRGMDPLKFKRFHSV